MRTLQIGVIGSMADLAYSQQAIIIARKIGTAIAESGNVLVFGAEKDSDSLPTQAAVSARKSGGTTIGITYEKGLDLYNQKSASVVIATGLVRGGGRELVQSLSCDGIIAIAGGSGTLNEICVAYQATIPVVVIDGFNGWALDLKDKYLDNRKRYTFSAYLDPNEALNNLLKMIQSKQYNYESVDTTI